MTIERMKIILRFCLYPAVLLSCLFTFSSVVYSNNLAIGDVSFSNLTASSIDLSFSVSQEHSFITYTSQTPAEVTRDCVWIFIKFSTSGVSGPWRHATINGVNNVVTATDNKGVYLFWTETKAYSSRNVQVRWFFTAEGLSSLPAEVRVKALGMELVAVSTGAFIYNAGGDGGSGTNNFGDGSQMTVDSIDDVPTGCATSWPNGYREFFCAKYEVSQRQYADYLNLVDPNGSSAHTYYDETNYDKMEYYIKLDNSRPVGDRYYVEGGHDDLACNWLSWTDDCRYASWCAMRPMTEMEYERAARGGTVSWAYPWGNVVPDNRVYNSTETKSGTSFDCFLYYANHREDDADTQGLDGPVPVGHYLSGLNISGNPITRTAAQTGASQYGIADLCGNVFESVINCQSLTTPENGNGTLTPPASWPPADANNGSRGGSFRQTDYEISHRGDAAWYGTTRWYPKGFRPVRTP